MKSQTKVPLHALTGAFSLIVFISDLALLQGHGNKHI